MGALEELVAKAGGCGHRRGLRHAAWGARRRHQRPALERRLPHHQAAPRQGGNSPGPWLGRCLLLVYIADLRVAMQSNPQQMPSDYCVSVRRGPREINYCCASCECEDTEFARVADDIFFGSWWLYPSSIFPIKNRSILPIRQYRYGDTAFSKKVRRYGKYINIPKSEYIYS
jgi:hypothetical protein